MEPISMAFATAAMAQLCLQVGSEVISKCSFYRNAETELADSILILESAWAKTEFQLKFITRIWAELDENLKSLQHRQLRALETKLIIAERIIDGFARVDVEEKKDSDSANRAKPMRKRTKLKYAVTAKETLREAIDDVKKWQAEFDMSWYMLIRVQGPAVDRQLSLIRNSPTQATEIVRRLRDFHKANAAPNNNTSFKKMIVSSSELVQHKPIPHSNASLAYRKTTTTTVIVDRVPLAYGSLVQNIPTAERDIGNLALILSKVDTEVFGTLACNSLIRVEDDHKQLESFDFLFTLPKNARNPRSLRSLLLDTPPTAYTLNQRLHLAQVLARSIIFLHAAKILHKNVSPESVIVFHDPDTRLDTPYLVGFREFRFDASQTYLVGNARWDRNIYRHPHRQGRPEQRYRMQHDIYSLGVCLLEVGLWAPFVRYVAADTAADADADVPAASPHLDLSAQLAVKNPRKRASEIKKALVGKAEAELPSRMGSRYTSIVVSCLTCLDRGNDDFADEDGEDGEDSEKSDDDAGDTDGVLVGVRYIEKIISELDKISL